MAERIGIITANSLNVRPAPTTLQEPVGTLLRGTAVTVLRQVGSWYEVRTENLTGFVHGDFLRLRESQPAAGFLHERALLQQVPLEPEASARISPTSAMTSLQKAAVLTWNRYGGLLAALGQLTQVDSAAAIAVLLVESSGNGFGPDGRMIIRFENHTFGRQWGEEGRARFGPCFRYNTSRPWTGHEYRQQADLDWVPCHTSQASEWEVFAFARTLNEAAAMRSISMGAPQIMGFNHAHVGYDSVRAMFDNFSSDIRYQLLGLFDFIIGPGTTSTMLQALQRNKFELFASFYNGPGQAAAYGDRINRAYQAFQPL